MSLFHLRFGVCCVFMTSTCGDTITMNCSYIKNPSYPSALTSTSACSFTIGKCDNCKIQFSMFKKHTISYFVFCVFQAVCDLRLDFERFTTNGPSLTTEANGGLCQDMLTITTVSWPTKNVSKYILWLWKSFQNTGQVIPEICGENSGQHGKGYIYVSNRIVFTVHWRTVFCFVFQYIWISVEVARIQPT